MNKNNNYSNYSSLHAINIPKPIKILQKIILITFLLITLILILTPWRQTAPGFGYVIAQDPNYRAQTINAPLNGKIKEWFVKDGSKVQAGDKLVEIVDNDPQIIEKLQAEKDAKYRKYEVAKIASETSKLNFDRQQELF